METTAWDTVLTSPASREDRTKTHNGCRERGDRDCHPQVRDDNVGPAPHHPREGGVHGVQISSTPV
jgi:hypothetical protein